MFNCILVEIRQINPKLMIAESLSGNWFSLIKSTVVKFTNKAEATGNI